MNVVILGAGAVGGYFGGKIAKAGFPVTFLVREKRFEQLKKNGLNVTSFHGDFSLEPTLAKEVESINDPELVIVGLKNYHLDSAMPTLEKLVKKGAKILPLLNGIHHLDRLKAKFGDGNVLGGLCYIETTLNENGDVVQTSSMQDIVFGSLTANQSKFLTDIKDMMEQSHINITLSEDIMKEMWKKYIFLASLSGITASVRQPIGVAVNDEKTFSFLSELVREIYQISNVRGIGLPEEAVDQVLDKMKGLPPTMTASMHRDLEKGFPMELESLHGALLEMAKENKVSTPHIKAVYSLLHPYKDGQPSK